MTGPQKENGYTPIANEILEQLAKIRIPGQARQVLDVILRQTYGWNKKADVITLSKLSEATGIEKPHVIRAKNKLLAMNLIAQKGNKKVAKKGNRIGLTYSFNKHYKDWKQVPVGKPVAKNGNNDCQKRQQPLPKMATPLIYSKDTTKDTQKKEDCAAEKTDHQVVVDYWHDQYLEVVGTIYDFDDSKDFRQFKLLLKKYSVKQIFALIDELIETDDLWLSTKRTPVWLYSKRNELIQAIKKRSQPQMSERQRKNAQGMAEYLREEGIDDGSGQANVSRNTKRIGVDISKKG